MNIVIRADSSTSIGSGHIMRCLTLAERLREKGCTVTFVCRARPGNINQLISRQGYDLSILPAFADDDGGAFDREQDAAETAAAIKDRGIAADWLIADHYRIDWKWQRLLRPCVGKIFIIDDLADRKHDCDALLDQNFYQHIEQRYQGLVPAPCRCFLGPRYALLRKEFINLPTPKRIRDGTVRRILVFLGGSDPTNETAKILEAMKALGKLAVAIDVVVGGANPHKDEIQRLCGAMPQTVYHCQVDNMAELMDKADLAIGAGGSATWERCYTGLPCLTIIIADNQAKTTAAVAAYGAAWNLGRRESVSSRQIIAALQALLADPAEVRRAGEACRRLMQGNDAGQRTLISEILGE